nr:hypothetical protein [Neobacillus sp. Marseille-Q6967]
MFNRVQVKMSFPNLFILIIIAVSILSSCTSQQHAKPKPPDDKEQQSQEPTTLENWKIPIEIPEGEFYKIGGWLSDQEILYITNKEQTSNVYRYHMNKGKSELLYKSDVPIATLQVSPSKNYILIQSAPSTYEGKLTVISSHGEEKISASFAAHEIVYEWNSYNESEILVTSFSEDWTFQMKLINIETNETSDISLPQPFIKWLGREEIAFLNWDNTSPSLMAPLMIKELNAEVAETFLPDVLQFSIFRDLIVTMTVDESNQDLSVYSFYDQDKNSLSSFSIPHLSMFSGWLVPFYDFNGTTGQFITFKPVKSGDADAYSEGFELIAYNVVNGSTKMILDGLKNEPILLDPSGESALYGNQYEKLIDFSSKKIFELVKE